MEKRDFKTVKYFEFEQIRNEIFQSNYFFNCDLERLSKHFLEYFLPIEVFKADFKTILESYREHIFLTDIFSGTDFIDIRYKEKVKKDEEKFKDEKSFHRYVCEEHLHIKTLPKDELLSWYEKASEDLQSIDETLNYIEGGLNEVNQKNDVHKKQELKPILEYYKEHNVKAKLKIIDFITHDIRSFVIKRLKGDSFPSGFFFEPYGYNKDLYWPQRPSVMINKCGDLLVPEHTKLQKLYYEDNVAFTKAISDYINDNNTLFKIRDSILYSHILYERREYIEELLNLYENGSHMIFTSCVPSFIEGVFHDLCLVFGYDNNELLSEGFQKKVDKLKENLGHHLCYEYYIFYFRLLRNRVAHGQVKGSEIAGLANILLLDMEHITSLVNLETIPYNYKLFVLNELEKNINTPNYKYLMKFVLMDKVVIPDYYNVTKERNEAIYDLLKTQEFWGFIDHELEYDSPTVKHGIHFVLQKINKLIPNYQECKSRLSQLGIKSTDKKLADHYLKYLTRDRITI